MNVGVVGVGLIGGSIARALKAHEVPLWLDDASPATQAALTALQLGEVAPWPTWIGQVDAVVLGVPLSVESDLVRHMVPAMRAEATLVDLSSVKRPVQSVLQWASERVVVLSLHLMAGRETRGFSASSPDLFRDCAGAVVDIGAGFPPEEAVHWWQAHLGTAPLSRWTIAEHDDAVAWVSHLPFLVSRALARLVERKRPAALALAGPGYRDTSRVGRSDVSLMRPMLLANQAVLREALVALQEEIERTAAELLCEQNSPSEGT